MISNRNRRLLPLVAAITVAVTIIAFWPVVNNGFVHHDDGVYLILNPVVAKGLTVEGVHWAFTTNHAGYWHPVTWLSHMLDVQIFVQIFKLDPETSAGGHHAMSLAIHAANAVLLLLLLNRMTGSSWRSAAVAMLFALHPLRVESVAWASERKDLLSALFGLGAMLAYVRYARSPGIGRYVLVAVLFALSLMAKPMLVTLPLVLLLLDFWPLRRFDWPTGAGHIHSAVVHDSRPTQFHRERSAGLCLEKAPLLALSALFSVITVFAQRHAGAMDFVQESLPGRIANALISYVRYLGKTFWPDDLAAFYPYPENWAAWKVAGSAMILLTITGASIVLGRRHRYLITGWFWFIGTLVPVIGIVQVGLQSMADRFTYFPHIGLFIMLVWGTEALVQRARLPAAGRCGVAGVALIVVIALSVVTHGQTKHWRSSQTLYEHTIQSTTGNYVMLDSLARVYASQGRDAEALELWKRAANLRPTFASYQTELGEAMLKVGDLRGAMEAYERALVLQPDAIDALNNLAWLLATYPEAAARDGRRAVKLAQRACDLTGNTHAGNLDTLAAAYAEAGNFAKAIETARQAHKLAIDGNQPELASIIDGHIRQFEASRPIRIIR
ncbi:MAG: tetratricopeptide repeat protein [Phycisphaerales bacterium]|nr:tetratricopeptide repeat protein [Phycisphaerales bacterium]